MTSEQKHMHRWVNRQPCECGDPGPFDVFEFLDSDAGHEWKREGDRKLAEMEADEP